MLTKALTKALCSACCAGDAAEVSILLAIGEPCCLPHGSMAVDLAIENGTTPLLSACAHGHAGVAAVLLAAGAEVDKKMQDNPTPVVVACMKGHLACVKLLSCYGADRTEEVNGCDVHFVAEQRGKYNVSAWLRLSREWSSPLHHLGVISAGQARDLLRAGADLEAAAREGGPTPLSLARVLGEAGKATDDSAAQLVLRAAEPWSPESHCWM